MQKVGRRAVLLGAAGLVSLSHMHGAYAVGKKQQSSHKIEVMGHRGAPALRPEHTLASYARAIADGADYIEPDLQSTKDGVLVALHEPRLSHICDVAEHKKFASRKRVLKTPADVMDDWFLADFTFAELADLRLKERIPDIRPQNTVYNGEFQFLRLEQIIDFVAAESATRGRLIGLVPELKFPALHEKMHLPVTDMLLDLIPRFSYLRQAPLVIQCFEAAPLQKIHAKIGGRPHTRLMQLIDTLSDKPMDVLLSGGTETYADMVSPSGLKRISAYADIVAPDIRTLIPLDKNGALGVPSPMIRDAHAVGLSVMAYSFRPENSFLSAGFRDLRGEYARNGKGMIAEVQHYIRAGMDGFFTDDPALGRAAVDRYSA